MIRYYLYSTDRSGDSISGGKEPTFVRQTGCKTCAKIHFNNDRNNPYSNKEVKIVSTDDGTKTRWATLGDFND